MNHFKSIKNFCFVLLIFMLSSCAQKMAFRQSTLVPEAEGKVKVKEDANHNNSIELSVQHLSKPEKLDFPRKTYVVWMETERNGVKNIGQLNTTAGLFNKKNKASLETVTIYKPRRFFITAEDDAALQYPGSLVVLSTEPF